MIIYMYTHTYICDKLTLLFYVQWLHCTDKQRHRAKMRMEFRKEAPFSLDGRHISRNGVSQARSVLEASGTLRHRRSDCRSDVSQTVSKLTASNVMLLRS
jgi:hypothetical protein